MGTMGATQNTDRTVYAQGRVIAPDSSGVANAIVETQPLVTSTQANAQGYFRIFTPLSDPEYTFVGRQVGGEGVSGRTKVSTPGQAVQDTIYIILGREITLEATDIDSIRANPSGPGRKRSGGR